MEISAVVNRQRASAKVAPASEELALVIVWSADQPHRVGEVALLPTEHPRYFLGNPLSDNSPDAQRKDRGQSLLFIRQRPAGVRDRDTLELSLAALQQPMFPERQLELRPLKHAVFVKNLGSQPAFVNGIRLIEAPVVPGDTIYLQGRLVLYCTKRPTRMPPLSHYGADAAPFFGLPDDYGFVGESPAVWAARDRMASGGPASDEPPLSSRMEDLPLLINHMLRRCAQRDEFDLSRYFSDGLPRIHPQLIVQLLQRRDLLQLADLPMVLMRALANSSGDVIGPLPESAAAAAASMHV